MSKEFLHPDLMELAPGPSQPTSTRNMPVELRSLVCPNTVSKSSKDPHQGLYPRSKQMPQSGQSIQNPSFQKASEVYKASEIKESNNITESVDSPRRSFRLKQQKDGESSSTQQKKRPHTGKQYQEEKHVKKKQKLNISVPRSNKLHKYFEIDLNYSSRSKESKQNTLEKPSSSKADPSEYYSDVDSNDAGEISEPADKTSKQFERNESYYFGLFGATETCENTDEPDYFEWLPVPVVEQIFCQVPILDLLHLRLVCKSWKTIIDNEKFLQWKKGYYRLKKSDQVITHAQLTLMRTMCDASNVNSCLLSLIKYMTTHFRRSTPSTMLSLLEKGSKYQEAKDVLHERLPNEAANLSPWSVLTCMIILSENVGDIFSILDCLLIFGSPCSLYDILEALYCIAAHLFTFITYLKINHGIHYRLYHVLYTYENAFPRNVSLNVQKVCIQTNISGQQSIHKYCQPTEQRLTYEQIRILNHKLGPKQIVKIVAFAGTGKTTTLIHYARLYPQMKFLNVVFNKSVCEYAKKVFPQNVECRTAHSLAYRAIGKDYRHKLRVKLKPHDIVPHITNINEIKMHIYTLARLILDTIDKFTGSVDPEISVDHVPEGYSFTGRGTGPMICQPVNPITPATRQIMAREATRVWNMMIDRNNKEIGIVHDTYLKLYQLSRPLYHKYDCIMIDEAQDSDAAMLDIILSQNVPVILVGDPNQQIYGFRGADNALGSVQGTHVYYLTKSFRFGPEIAYAASCCIEVLKKSMNNTIVGTNKKSFIDGTVKGQYAIISRTNLQLFEEAIRLCCSDTRHPGEPKDVYGAFAGGLSTYNFEQFLDIHRMFAGGSQINEIKDKFLKRFKSISELFTYAKQADDVDLLGKIDLVRFKGYDIVDYVETIKKKCRYPMELANVIFSTAHKSKGLEFDTVCLTEDFYSGSFALQPPGVRNVSEEYNILYVAVTRAKISLLMSEALNKVFVSASEKFEYPVSSKQLLSNNISLTCCACSTVFNPHTILVMKRRSLTMSNNRKRPGGALCLKCGAMPKFRPEVHREMIVMFLDYVIDHHHCSMSAFVGPLVNDEPIDYEFEPPHQQILVYEIPIPRRN